MGARSDLLSMVDRSVGLYGTAPTCYLSGLARLPGFAIEEFDRAVEVDRSLVRVRAMRYSVHVFPRDLLVVALGATRPENLESVERRARRLGDAYPGLAAKVEAALGDGPLPAADIRSRVDPDRDLGSDFSLLLGRMRAESRVVRATSTGGWRSNRHTYALWEDWLPDVDPYAMEPEETRSALAERYVAAYGPVELDDLAWWAGWRKTDARAAADGLDLRAEGDAARLLEGVRLLPVWDVLMVAYRHRDRLLDPEHARFIYDRFGNATSVVLDGGRVAGVWDLGRADDPLSLRVAPLERWPERRWDEVEAEAGRIGEMIGAGSVEIVRAGGPVDLVGAPRNRFLSPLSG